jgi:hypothetical protein
MEHKVLQVLKVNQVNKVQEDLMEHKEISGQQV